jgi:hypothetical protein
MLVRGPWNVQITEPAGMTPLEDGARGGRAFPGVVAVEPAHVPLEVVGLRREAALPEQYQELLQRILGMHRLRRVVSGLPAPPAASQFPPGILHREPPGSRATSAINEDRGVPISKGTVDHAIFILPS